MVLSVSFDRNLADMNGDGKMDQLEFSIAMFLIKRKLQGAELPKVLPPSLKQGPMAGGMGGFGQQPMGECDHVIVM